MDGFALANILRSLIDLLNSEVTRLLFVIALIGIGIEWVCVGRMPKSTAISVIVGIGIVFSASYIAQKLGLGI